MDENANDRYGAFKVGTHDDLVTALGLAAQTDHGHAADSAAWGRSLPLHLRVRLRSALLKGSMATAPMRVGTTPSRASASRAQVLPPSSEWNRPTPG